MLTAPLKSLSCKSSVTIAVIPLMYNTLLLSRLHLIKNSALQLGSNVNKLSGVTS